jgi:hypothetical protein
MTDGGMAAAPKLPDFDALAVERTRLQRRLKEVETRHERLREGVVAFSEGRDTWPMRRTGGEWVD